MDNMALCLSCAFVHSCEVDSERECPKCGASITANDYRLVLDYAREVVHFGHQYRELYSRLESDSSDGRRFFLPPAPDWLAFVGVAILSGVLGNVSYELLLRAARRIVSQFRDRAEGDLELKTVDDAALRRMTEQFREYLPGLKGIPAPVRSAMLEEIIVDMMQEYLAIHPEIAEQLASARDEPAAHTRVVLRWRHAAIKARKQRVQPRPEHFASLWKGLDRSE